VNRPDGGFANRQCLVHRAERRGDVAQRGLSLRQPFLRVRRGGVRLAQLISIGLGQRAEEIQGGFCLAVADERSRERQLRRHGRRVPLAIGRRGQLQPPLSLLERLVALGERLFKHVRLFKNVRIVPPPDHVVPAPAPVPLFGVQRAPGLQPIRWQVGRQSHLPSCRRLGGDFAAAVGPFPQAGLLALVPQAAGVCRASGQQSLGPQRALFEEGDVVVNRFSPVGVLGVLASLAEPTEPLQGILAAEIDLRGLVAVAEAVAEEIDEIVVDHALGPSQGVAIPRRERLNHDFLKNRPLTLALLRDEPPRLLVGQARAGRQEQKGRHENSWQHRPLPAIFL
jgi:hypothetical protein